MDPKKLQDFTEEELDSLKKDIILFSLLNTKDYLHAVLGNPDTSQEDLELAHKLSLVIDYFLDKDYPESPKDLPISKPNWNDDK